MIQFNKLQISADKLTLTIDCEVKSQYSSYYHISEVYLEYYENARALSSTGSLSDKAVTLSTPVGTNPTSYSTTVVSQQLSGTGTDTFDGGMFFVVVKCEVHSTPPASLSCEETRLMQIGVALDWRAVYARGMQFVSVLAIDCNTCSDYDGFEQFILNWYGLRLALATCDTEIASRMWDRFLRTGGKYSGVKAIGCGCGS